MNDTMQFFVPKSAQAGFDFVQLTPPSALSQTPTKWEAVRENSRSVPSGRVMICDSLVFCSSLAFRTSAPRCHVLPPSSE